MSPRQQFIKSLCLLTANSPLRIKSDKMMLTILCLVAFLTVSHGYSDDPMPIVGGQNADRGEYPWQGMLLKKNQFHCGASLIRSNVAMTAAHCVVEDERASTYKVVFGEHNTKTNEGSEQTIQVVEIMMHEDYDDDTVENDIALLRLSEEVELNEYVEMTGLANENFEQYAQGSSSNCWVSGWGVSNEGKNKIPSVLQELKSDVLTKSECNKQLKPYGYKITEDMICTLNSNSGVCFGDSGGPMGCFVEGRFIQVGIVSWGPGRCASGKQVFARVSHFRDWIREKLDD